jgi:serine protease Do
LQVTNILPQRQGNHVPAVVCVLLAAAVALEAQDLASRAEAARRLSDSLVNVTDRLAPAVVLVTSKVDLPVGDESSAAGPRRSTGSGVIVSPDGYIVTNAHVVAGATKVGVQLSSRDAPKGSSLVRPRGRTFLAKVVGSDLETDLAVLKVQADSLPFLPLADSDAVRQGQMVLALGNPLGLESSVSMGVVSAVARQLRPDDPVVYIQTDAPVNPGNSGGPLADVDGNVIGINTLILSQSGGSEGLGFAVPSNVVRTVTEQLKTTGVVARGDIQVQAQTITPELAGGLGLALRQGVILADVRPLGPAAEAGLEIGDVVLALNGKPMENARQFHVNLYRQPVGSVVTLELLRGERKLTKAVPVVLRLDAPERYAALVDAQRDPVPRLGIVVVPVNEKARQWLPISPRWPRGLLVAKLAPGSYTPLRPGDVIYSVNNRPAWTLEELQVLLDHHQPGDTAVLQVERGGALRYVEVVVD